MDREQFVSEMAKLRASATFLTLLGYRNEHSEIADYSIIFHISYENALKRSVAILKDVVTTEPMLVAAKQELINGYTASLKKMAETPVEEVDDAYVRFFDKDGKHIKGLKLHSKTDTLHLYGFVNSKRVIMPGLYPTRNKRDLTVAKDTLRKMVPVSRFRQFIITPNHVDAISVEGLRLTPPGI